jgi:magnesium chelatase family protein
LLDRIDIQIELGRLEHQQLIIEKEKATQTSSEVRQRVCNARKLQLARQGCVNARLSHKDLDQMCGLSRTLQQTLINGIEKLRLSTRSYHKLLKLARTIADLAAAGTINETHIAEAISYRRQDRRQA